MSDSRLVRWFPPGVALDDTDNAWTLAGDGAPFMEVTGGTGDMAPVWSKTWAATPGVDGALLVDVTAGPQSWSVGLMPNYGTTRGGLMSVLRGLTKALNPKAGVGTLVVGSLLGTADGEVRRAAAVYEGGLGGDELLRLQRFAQWPFTLQFTLPDARWYSLEDVAASWAGLAGEAGFPWSFDWSFPVGGVTVDVPLELGGDAETFPSWQIDPPFYRVKVTNDRSGEWWEVRRSMDDRWSSLTLSARPSTVRDADGVNRYALLTSGSRLFALLPGDAVSVQVDGGSTATRLALTAGEAWNTA